MFEAAKGMMGLAVGLGLLLLVHRDLPHEIARLVRQFHLNPAARTPRLLLGLADEATKGRLELLAAGTSAYTLLRFVEAYGLWRGQPWAAWIAVIGCGLYLPIEIREFYRDPGWVIGFMFAVNLTMFGYLSLALIRHGRLGMTSA